MGISSRRKALKEKAVAGSSTSPAKRVHKKVPGFNAFAKNKSVIKKKKKNKRLVAVEVEDVEEPVEGIHSKAWADAIAPQPNCGLLKLPLEVRVSIYKLVIDDFTIDKMDGEFMPIEPRKKGDKFSSYNWSEPGKDTERLYMICRQIYVDVVGSGLIYELIPFSFTSQNAMLNYLLVIHPVHKDAIRSVDLSVTINCRCYPFRPSVPEIFQPLACSTLASMPKLNHLTLRCRLGEWTQKKFTPHIRKYSTKEKVLEAVVKCSDLIGNGLKDGEGGEGGIRGLKTFQLFCSLWVRDNSKAMLDEDEDAQKWASVEEALRSVMVRS